jgi:beta-glucanase (GH16 family)
MRFRAAFIALAALAFFAPAQSAHAHPGAPAIDEPGGLPPGYSLVWSDEFDSGSAPDPRRWTYDTHRNREGWYNDELQYYSGPRRENARIENGVLVIEARRERLDRRRYPDWGGQAYTSTRLTTQGRASWTYGFIEVRAKLPCGVGSWPAIWTLSEAPRSAWPDDGEIDIMEHVGFDPGVINAAVHTGAYNHPMRTHTRASVAHADACTQFHRYQMTWTRDRIAVGVDDRNYYQFANDGSGRAAWPFDHPQYLILNIAVGGGWGGMRGIDDAAFPMRMEVDHVRVYQAR